MMIIPTKEPPYRKDIVKHESMRGYFAYYLYAAMLVDPDIWLITADLGYGMFDNIRDDFPDRFINTGAAEQSAVGIAVGLALEGKKPFIYSITSFLLRRPFETISLYMNHEQIPVRLVGGGRDKDYEHDGFSHWSLDAAGMIDDWAYISGLWPDTKEEIPKMVKRMVKENKPWFISLKR